MQRKGFTSLPSRLLSAPRLVTCMQVSLLLATAHVASAQMTVSSVSPASGPVNGGNLVRLFGSGFNSSTNVWFWANQAPVVRLVSATEIDVQAPARGVVGAVDVAVFDSQSNSFRIAGGYTYANVAPAPAPTPTPVPKTTPPPPPTPTPTPAPTPTPDRERQSSKQLCGSDQRRVLLPGKQREFRWNLLLHRCEQHLPEFEWPHDHLWDQWRFATDTGRVAGR